ncbi:MAG: hypothetical protein AABX73_01455 [Nanoarchaeota archaeon]
MTEKVSTGGLMSFKYEKTHAPKLNEDEKKEIEKAYEKYYERKRKEKKRRVIIISIITVILLVSIYFLLK